MKLSFNEILACKVLSRLRHDGQNFEDCRYNDLLIKFVETTLNVDPIELITRIVEHHESI